jgi:molybdenum cofactor cytidylyltransferase
MSEGVVGILLAAGRSERFGANKLLHILPDSHLPMAQCAARALVEALPDSVAVIRPGDKRLKQQLHEVGISVVVNEQADAGMGTSLAWGISSKADATGWVVALADMPYIPSSVIAQIADALAQGAAIAAPAYQGRRGHPVGFSHEFGEALMQLSGDEGARDLVQRHRSRLQLIEVDEPGVLYDIDTHQDVGDSD